MHFPNTPSTAEETDILREKQIIDAALEAGWVKNGNCYEFPTVAPDGTRVAWHGRYNITEEARARYGKVNLSGKPAQIRYYLLEDTRAAIVASGGLVHISSGITDMLAFRAAGFKNVLTWFGGENSIPTTLEADLRELGVTKVRYYPDNDEAGTRAAARLSEILDEGFLDVMVVPNDVKDIGDLWKMFSRMTRIATGVFTDVISNMDVACFLLFVKESPQKANATGSDSAGSSLSDSKIHPLVAAAIRAKAYELGGCENARGWINNVPCPHTHADDSENKHFGVNPNGTGGYCFGSHGAVSALKICEAWGIDYLALSGISDTEQPEPPFEASETAFAEVEEDCRICIPRELRLELIREKKAKLSLFLDRSLALGFLPGETFSIKEWYERSVREQTGWYKSVNALHNATRDFLTELSPFLFATVERKSDEKVRHRPEKLHTLPTLDALGDYLNAFWIEDYTVLFPLSALKSVKAYLAYQHTNFIRKRSKYWNESDKFPSSKSLGERVGRTARTICAYEKENPNIIRKRRFYDEIVPEGYELSPDDKRDGFVYVAKLPNGLYARRKMLTSMRSYVENVVEPKHTCQVTEAQTSAPKITSVVEPLSETPENKINMLFCRNCGQSIAADFGKPRSCDFCGANGGDVWQDTPPDTPITDIPRG